MHSLGKAEETKQAMQERIVEMTANYCEVGVDPDSVETTKNDNCFAKPSFKKHCV